MDLGVIHLNGQKHSTKFHPGKSGKLKVVIQVTRPNLVPIYVRGNMLSRNQVHAPTAKITTVVSVNRMEQTTTSLPCSFPAVQ